MEEREGLVERILAAHPNKFGPILQKSSQYRFQVLLSQVERHPSGQRRLVRHGYRVDAEYFYPASAIKLAAVVAAVQKLEERFGLPEYKGFHLATPLCFYPLLDDGEEERYDATNSNDHKITLAHEIRKLFLVSDNEAFNRLYAVVGHRNLNEIMWNRGFKSVRLHHRLCVSLLPSVNRCCQPVEVNVNGSPYVLAPKKSEFQVPDNGSIPGVLLGKAYVTETGELIEKPMDCSLKNYISLLDLQNLLVQLVRPDVEALEPAGTLGVKLGGDVRMMLLEAMSQYLASSSNPHYDGTDYPDDYGKFFLPGVARVRSKGAIRIYNKIGRAYGFTVDNAYVLDIETGESFFLAAVLYTNKNEIVNDDMYEYEDVADKVMADLGEVIADALWNVPDGATNSSSLMEKTPSSLWSILNPPVSEPSPLELPEQSSVQALVLPDDQEELKISNSEDNADEGDEPEEKVKLEQTLVSGVPSAGRNIRSCYQYFVDE
ncbi:unnamed protein product [Calypogeia fissa]